MCRTVMLLEIDWDAGTSHSTFFGGVYAFRDAERTLDFRELKDDVEGGKRCIRTLFFSPPGPSDLPNEFKP